MKRAAKWMLVLWSALCLGGLGHSLAHTIPALHNVTDNDEREMAQINLASAAVEWLAIWAVLAIPFGIALNSPNKPADR